MFYFRSLYQWVVLLLLLSHCSKCCATESLLQNPVGIRSRKQYKIFDTTFRNLQTTTNNKFAIRVNAGGENDFVDSNGRLWVPDRWVDKGQIASSSICSSDIANTTDDLLYCSNRYFLSQTEERPFAFNISLPYAATCELRMHFAELTYQAVGRRIFNIFVENELRVRQLDVYAIAGSFTAYTISIEVPITDQTLHIRFVPVINDPFISAIEVLEISSTTKPEPIISEPSTEMIRINSGGEEFIDSKGNFWAGDIYFQEKGESSAKTCNTSYANTTNGELYCTERFFRTTYPSPYIYNIPVNSTANYRIFLHFSENHFFETGKRLFDVLVENATALENFDLIAVAGGPAIPYIFSIVKNITDGYASIEFIPKINYPTISAIEVILVEGNETTGNSPIANDTSSQPSTIPLITNNTSSPNTNVSLSQPSEIRSEYPSLAPTFTSSNLPTELPSFSVSDEPTTLPSVDVTWAPVVILYKFNLVTKTVKQVRMDLGRSNDKLEVSQALNSNCTSMWQDTIKEKIEAEIMTKIPQYESFAVNLYNVARSSNFSALSLTFDIDISIRSPLGNFFDSNRLITGPFESQSKRNEYIQFLSTTSCPEFDGISTMQFTIISSVNAKKESSTEKEDGSNKFYFNSVVIIGAGVAIGVIICAVLIIYNLSIHRRRKINIKMSHPTKLHLEQSTHDKENEYHDELDISTLGDSIISHKPTRAIDASTVGSVTEYDYNQAFMELNSVSESMIIVDSLDPIIIHHGCDQVNNLFIEDIISVTSEDLSYKSNLLYL